MEMTGTSNAATSAAFLQQLRARHAGPLVVIRDNGPAHGGEAMRNYLATPGLNLRLVRLPAYSPDFKRRQGDLGLGARGGHRQHLPGHQGQGIGADGALPRRSEEAHR